MKKARKTQGVGNRVGRNLRRTLGGLIISREERPSVVREGPGT